MPEEQKVIRKLRAILSADVKGYSLLMADDEVHTIQTLKTYRRIIADFIAEYSGRVVDSPGDNILAEFRSAVDAVECAAKIQEKLAKENSKFVEEKMVQFRIGVNVGDVIQDGDRIYGNGVNVAARIEGLADPGGICVSRGTYDHVKDKVQYRFEYLGEHTVKNIKELVRLYRVLMDSDVHVPLVKEQLELPDKPSIAVLPFTNMSGNPSQEYFSDGLTEQIISGLSKVRNLFVIARNSCFAYKGKAISAKQIAQELGVKFILEGSVQKVGDRVRITAQLIDAKTDYHMWAESYDRDLLDIFALQDDITMKLIFSMEVNLTVGEQARLWEGGTTNIQAYDYVQRGFECFYRANKKDNKQAQKFFNAALNIDRSYAIAYSLLGYTHIVNLTYGWSKSPLQSFADAESNVEKAITLNDSLDLAHSLLGWINLFKNQHNEAIKEGERAIELNPNGAEAHANLAFIHIFSDQTQLAVELLKRAFRLNPIPPSHYYYFLAIAYRNDSQYDKAVHMAKKGLINNPDFFPLYLILSASYIMLNRTEEAHQAAGEVLRIDPSFSLGYYSTMFSVYKNQENADKFIRALRKAGLPE